METKVNFKDGSHVRRKHKQKKKSVQTGTTNEKEHKTKYLVYGQR